MEFLLRILVEKITKNIKIAKIFLVAQGTINTKIRKNCRIIFIAILLANCKHTLTLNSNPKDAEVYLHLENGSRGTLLGKTPLTLDSVAGHAFVVQKSGYAPSYIFLPVSDLGREVSLKIDLPILSESWVQDALLAGSSTVFEKMSTDLLLLQQYLFLKKDQEFLIASKKMETRFSKTAIFHNLVGFFYLGKKDYKSSLESFQKSLEIDPTNKDALASLKLIKH